MKKALEQNPSNAMAAHNIASIYKEKNKMPEAIQWSEKAQGLDPQHTWASLQLSEMYGAVGMDDETKAVLEAGVQMHPDFLPFYESPWTIMF